MTEDEDEDVLAPLTELQEKVLTYIEQRIADGRPPSRVEIGETFDIWPSSAAQILRALARKDRIQLIPPLENVPRETQVAVVNGNFGARDRDRTCDPYHVKALSLEDFQSLKSANDD
jgi:hypothetical protein